MKKGNTVSIHKDASLVFPIHASFDVQNMMYMGVYRDILFSCPVQWHGWLFRPQTFQRIRRFEGQRAWKGNRSTFNKTIAMLHCTDPQIHRVLRRLILKLVRVRSDDRRSNLWLWTKQTKQTVDDSAFRSKFPVETGLFQLPRRFHLLKQLCGTRSKHFGHCARRSGGICSV